MNITEKFVPIQIRQEQCAHCERCMTACRNDAIYFEDGIRLINYSKCKGCLDCVNVCPRNIIEVTSVTPGKVLTIKIDHEKCSMCMDCVLKDGKFCPNELFSVGKVIKDGKEVEGIRFNFNQVSKCQGCLKCELSCPEGAIKPIIFEE
ncbi:MAG: 4Fe-4S dicluster domain-containing protein [Promethearchaeota archaeon]|nr:MAG: 4Fe-4S dicluster domain-containing protein [Candidatus Lokiarchaeota archaeon]